VDAVNRRNNITSREEEGGVKRAARFLFGRQIFGVLVSVGAVLAITRSIGPSAYGTYASAFGIVYFLQNVGSLGIGTYLKRLPNRLTDHDCDQAFTLLAPLSFLTTAIGLVLVFGGVFAHPAPAFSAVACALLATIPLMHLQQIYLSRLEVELAYDRVGTVELVGLAMYFAVGFALARVNAGPWAPVGGWWAQQLALTCGFAFRSNYLPRLAWSASSAGEMLKYGAASTAATIAFSLKSLVVPVYIPKAIGTVAVGQIALSIRILEQLAFLRQVTSRMAIPILARKVREPEALRRAFTMAAELQLLAVAVPVVAFALVSGRVIPAVFGPQWSAAGNLVPLLAPPALALAAFNLHNVVLGLNSRPLTLFVSHAVGATCLWSAAVTLVPVFGIEGYAFAELAAMGSWLITDKLVARRYPRPKYPTLLTWWLGASLTALAPVLSWWLLFAAPAALLSPWSLRALRKYVMLLSERAHVSPDLE
jgi:PST family polysaccharide transporter